MAISSTAHTSSLQPPSQMQYSSLAIPTAASQSSEPSVSTSQSSTWRPATVARTNASQKRPTAESWISSPMSIWHTQSMHADTLPTADSLRNAHTSQEVLWPKSSIRTLQRSKPQTFTSASASRKANTSSSQPIVKRTSTPRRTSSPSLTPSTPWQRSTTCQSSTAATHVHATALQPQVSYSTHVSTSRSLSASTTTTASR